jgi:uncharacterized protein YbaA (DUF1428 family)
VKAKTGETVMFSWVVFKSRAHRDRVNAKVMADPRLHRMMPKTMPFEMMRMTYGGFDVLVEGKPPRRAAKRPGRARATSAAVAVR